MRSCLVVCATCARAWGTDGLHMNLGGCTGERVGGTHVRMLVEFTMPKKISSSLKQRRFLCTGHEHVCYVSLILSLEQTMLESRELQILTAAYCMPYALAAMN